MPWYWGLRPGTTDPITKESREEILHHWQAVHKMTGQEFDFNNALPDGFVYDTEPSSRAVIVVSENYPTSTLPYFKAVQAAFYREQKDVTNKAVLAVLASLFGVESSEFLQRYEKETVREKTLLHFQHTRQAGVRGFPTLVYSQKKYSKCWPRVIGPTRISGKILMVFWAKIAKMRK